MAAKKTDDAQIGKLVRGYQSRMDDLEPFHKAMALETAYCLKQAHWEDAAGMDLRPSRLQPVGRQLLQTVMHMAAQISRSEVYIDARPVDRRGDLDKAEVARQLLEAEIQSPRKLYHLLRDRLALFSLAGRMSALKVSFDPDIGPFGEVLFNEVNGQHIAWTKGYFTAHDPHCPELWETIPMDRDSLMAMRPQGWDVDGLVPDAEDELDAEYQDFPGQSDIGANGAVREQHLFSDKYKIVIRWTRNLKQRVKEEKAYHKLHADMRFMQCGKRPEMGCGFRSLPQWQARQVLPERDQRMCPGCGGDLHRVDAVAVEEARLAYPDGRIQIFAPNQGKLIAEDRWPQRMRSFPYLIFPVRDYPGEAMGSSITSEMYTRQSQLDIMDRQAMEQMAESRPLWALPDGDVLADYQKRPFYFGDDQGNIAFYKAAFGRSGIELHQPAGLPAAWATARNSFAADFERSQGTNDMSLDPDRSRNIPVGTVQAFERIRELPVDHLIERLRWWESILFGCTWDIMREEYTDERLRRIYGPDGVEKIQAIRVSEYPDMDVQVTASPTLARTEKAAAETSAYIAGLPRHIRRFVARNLNVPVSVLRELERDEDALGQPQPGGAPGALPAAAGGLGAAQPVLQRPQPSPFGAGVPR